MNFPETVLACWDTPGFVAEFDRLHGSTLASGDRLNRAIDEATGKREEDLRAFVAFVREVVWDRLVPPTPPERP